MADGDASVAIGAVVIGRNEGERLRRCLSSIAGRVLATVYVDSGSTDGSRDVAAASGAVVMELDTTYPFTAARARNAGAERLTNLHPGLPFVQFVDGDCEVQPGWLETAAAHLRTHAEVAVACGRRRERHPDRSIYNRLCDVEWNTPVGDAKACGGDSLVRRDAFEAVGGFRGDLIAGEEPELCVRLRLAGWRVHRLDAEMTLHDAAMTRFGQWWKRAERTGYAFAEGARLHGALPERHWVREARSARLWGVWLPLAVALFAGAVSPWALLGLVVYPLQIGRLFWREPGSVGLRAARAAFLVLGKFPEAIGQLRYFIRTAVGMRPRLIEYK